MQNTSSDQNYQSIIAGDYETRYRVKLLDGSSSNDHVQLTVTVNTVAGNPPSVTIVKTIWEASSLGGVSGSYVFTFNSDGKWYYGATGYLDISIFGIMIPVETSTGKYFTAQDTITVSRSYADYPTTATFDEGSIIEISSEASLFSGDKPGIGGCFSAQFEMELRNGSTTIPKMAPFRLEFQIYNRSLASQWYPVGTFFVDTRTPDKDLGTTKFDCYDSMLKAEKQYSTVTSLATGNLTQDKVIEDIAKLIGVKTESGLWSKLPATTRTFKMGPISDRTMREILGEIGTANCGNFVISANNELRFIPFQGIDPTTVYNLDNKFEDFEPSDDFKPYDMVVIWVNDNKYYTYPYSTFDQSTWESSKYGTANGDHKFKCTSVTRSQTSPYSVISSTWSYNGVQVNLVSYGIGFVGDPQVGDQIVVTRSQNLDISAVRKQNTIKVPINSDVWDRVNNLITSKLGQSFLTWAGNVWQAGSNLVQSLSSYGIDLSGYHLINGDNIRTVNEVVQNQKITSSTSREALTVEIDEDVWKSSNIGSTDGSFIFEYSPTSVAAQMNDQGIGTPIVGKNLNNWLLTKFARNTQVNQFKFRYKSTHVSTLSALQRPYGESIAPGTNYYDLTIYKDIWETKWGGRASIPAKTYFVARTSLLNPIVEEVACIAGQGSHTYAGVTMTAEQTALWNTRFAGLSGTFRFTYSIDSNGSYYWHYYGPVNYSVGTLTTDFQVTNLSDYGLSYNHTTPSLGSFINVTVREGNPKWYINSTEINDMTEYGIYIGNPNAIKAGDQILMTYVYSTNTVFGWEYENEPGIGYTANELGITYDGYPVVNTSTIDVIMNTSNETWAYHSGDVEHYTPKAVMLSAYGISITGGQPENGDTITVRSTFATKENRYAALTTEAESIDVDSAAWDQSDLGKTDGSFDFTYHAAAEGESEYWSYTDKEGAIKEVSLTSYGIYYSGSPNDGDVIEVTRSMGDPTYANEVVTVGREMSGKCSWGTRNMAQAVYNLLGTVNSSTGVRSGYIYKPYEATQVLLNPAHELGDSIKPDTNGVAYLLTKASMEYDHLTVADISAVSDEEVDHEYQYSDDTEKSLSRKVGVGVEYNGTMISNESGFTVTSEDGNSKIIFNGSTLSMQARIDGVMKDRIYFDPVKGDYVFSGAISADAVFTESLYADNGEIAELTVDQLETSKRIKEYVLDLYYRPNGKQYNTDCFIRIKDDKVQWITGVVQKDSNGEALTTQLKNRNGNPMYWVREIDHADENGRVYDSEGKSIYATETNTGYPVMIYSYDEQIKMAASFDIDEENGYYNPYIQLGTGYPYQGKLRSIGKIRKTNYGVEIEFLDDNAVTNVYRYGTDGLKWIETKNGTTKTVGKYKAATACTGIARPANWHALSNKLYGCSYYNDVTVEGVRKDATGYVIFDPTHEQISKLSCIAETLENDKIRIYATYPLTSQISITYANVEN